MLSSGKKYPPMEVIQAYPEGHQGTAYPTLAFPEILPIVHFPY